MHAASSRNARSASSARAGSILIDLLLSLWIIALFLPLIPVIVNLLSRQDWLMRSAQDQIQLQQLRRLLLGSEQIEVSHDQLAFYAEGQNRRLVQSGNWLLVQPGTWIFFDQVISVQFEQRQDQIWMRLVSETGEWEAIVGDAQ
ncbi:hypothetical protein [Holdemania massiliensis]|uniref:hypothetical protein n=1 Tax=Holdemania massiliensis TaxID=1468449 RepID=UPI001F060EAB|nr:hypothetical protein [Holdemania massiliensis]MCH1940627.1 hypothetical protein [Holdemania massiliensis]